MWVKRLYDGAVTVLTALLVAFGMHVFVYPAAFAPSGIDGIATMLQALTGVNAGIYTVLLNLPLLIAAWFLMRRRYVLYTLLYTAALSLFLLLLARFDFYRFVPREGSYLLSALFGGVAQGLTGIMLRIGASSGGVDIMGSMIQKKLPRFRVERIILLISVSIIAVSLPVYRDPESVLLSIVEAFVCERVTAAILQYKRPTV